MIVGDEVFAYSDFNCRSMLVKSIHEHMGLPPAVLEVTPGSFVHIFNTSQVG